MLICCYSILYQWLDTAHRSRSGRRRGMTSGKRSDGLLLPTDCAECLGDRCAFVVVVVTGCRRCCIVHIECCWVNNKSKHGQSRQQQQQHYRRQKKKRWDSSSATVAIVCGGDRWWHPGRKQIKGFKAIKENCLGDFCDFSTLISRHISHDINTC